MDVRSQVLIFLKGMGMGAADLIPGVSGGTIALISGIYPRFIASLNALDFSLVPMLLRGEIAGIWQKIDGWFLLVLFLGILTSIFSFAHGVTYAVDRWPVQVWAFFFGLILVSAILFSRRYAAKSLIGWIWVLFGCCFVIVIAQLAGPANVDSVDLWYIVLGASVSICAMMLPGISGSFVLIVLGLYRPTLEAVKTFDWLYLALFATGVALGFLLFSKVIHWLLNRHSESTFLFLTGLLYGALFAVWPWRDFASSNQPLNVSEYANMVGDPALGFALVFCILGGVTVILLSALSKVETDSSVDQ